MSYQVLARKWRPTDFQQMVGQEHVLKPLINALDSDRLHHAYLFTGTRGVGKTTIARIFAKALNCEQGVSASPCGTCSSCNEIDAGRSVDLIEIDAASRTGVDDMRELLDNVQYAPTRGRFKIYLIDEVHMLSKHSFNALLKTLEEPPPHVKFLLATTDPQKVPVTVLSRCLQFNLKRMSRAQILRQLQYITGEEQVEADSAALGQLAASADGSMRDALSLLDQAIGYGGGAVQQQAVESMLGSISRDYLLQLFAALAARQAAEVLAAARSVAEHNPDYQRVCAEMLELLLQIALYQSDPSLVDRDEYPAELLQQYSEDWAAEEIQLYYQILLQGRQDLLISPDQAGGFEMLMLRLVAFAPAAGELQVPLKKKPEPAGRLSDQPERSQAAPMEPRAASEAGADDRNESSQQARAEPAPSDARKVSGVPREGRREASRESKAEPDWSQLAYRLGLAGLAQEIAANSLLELDGQGSARLLLPGEIHELATPTIEEEIRQALEGALGLSLKLALQARQSLDVETPLQAKTRRLEEERLEAIAAIRQDDSVRKLERAFAVELDEASVVKIESHGNRTR